MLLRKYYSIDLILAYDLDQFVAFCYKAVEQQNMEIYRAQYIALLPFMHMHQLKYMPFDEYVDRITGRNIDLRPAEEIIAEIEALHGKGGT